LAITATFFCKWDRIDRPIRTIQLPPLTLPLYKAASFEDYPVALAIDSQAPHSPGPHSQAMDGRSATAPALCYSPPIPASTYRPAHAILRCMPNTEQYPLWNHRGARVIAIHGAIFEQEVGGRGATQI